MHDFLQEHWTGLTLGWHSLWAKGLEEGVIKSDYFSLYMRSLQFEGTAMIPIKSQTNNNTMQTELRTIFH